MNVPDKDISVPMCHDSSSDKYIDLYINNTPSPMGSHVILFAMRTFGLITVGVLEKLGPFLISVDPVPEAVNDMNGVGFHM
jgi:hypothetical protein